MANTPPSSTSDDYSTRAEASKNQSSIPFTWNGRNFDAGDLFTNAGIFEKTKIKIQPTTTGTSAGGVSQRLKNPLGNFASYTYNLSLYMLTPDAYDAFLDSNRTNINSLNNLQSSGIFSPGGGLPPGASFDGGTYTIVQSGGINNENQRRADGFELDYYIEDLQYKQLYPGGGTSTPIGQHSMEFKIVEPYGFSFISNLRKAAEQLMAQSKTLKAGAAVNIPSLKMTYVLGIRFYGYDINGNPVAPIQDAGGLDKRSMNGGVFETFIDIKITDIKFELGKERTEYLIKAVPVPQTGLGVKYGQIKTDLVVQGTTVNESLSGIVGLVEQLNKRQEQLKTEGKIGEATKYYIEFAPNAQGIAEAPMNYDGNYSEERYNTGGSGLTSSIESNPANELRAFPNNTIKTVALKPMSIVAAIEQVIKQSSFMTAALKRLENNVNAKRKESETILDNTQPVYWFAVTPELRNARWDSKTNSWAYDIKYLIEKFEVPFLYLDNVAEPNFPGISKSYNYFFTGLNTEVISYKQSINAAYLLNVVQNALGTTNINIETNDMPSGQTTTGTVNTGLTAQNNVITQIYDPKAFAQADIEIMGDPDFISPPASTGSTNSLYQEFTGNAGFSIKPYGGFIFIEIIFFEGQDYDVNTGIFNINESLGLTTFQNPEISKGIVYRVVEVTHEFRKGKFTQKLKCLAQDVSNYKTNNRDADGRQSTGTQSNQGFFSTFRPEKFKGLLGDISIGNVIQAPSRPSTQSGSVNSNNDDNLAIRTASPPYQRVDTGTTSGSSVTYTSKQSRPGSGWKIDIPTGASGP